MSNCPRCGSVVDQVLGHCAKCTPASNIQRAREEDWGAYLPEEPSNKPLAPSAPSPASMNVSSSEDNLDAIFLMLRTRIWVATLLLSLALILSLASIGIVIHQQLSLQDDFEKIVAEKFKDPKIEKTLTEIAQTKAVPILEKEIQPVVDQFRTEVSDAYRSVDETRMRLENQYAETSRTSALLENRKNVDKLSEQAMRGYRRSFEQLQDYCTRTEPEGLSKYAEDSVEKIERYFHLTNRLEGVSINFLDENGKGWVNEKVPTYFLMKELRNSPNWKIRARAAELLAARSEDGVPQVLLEAAETDPYLDVVKCALQSFNAVTGYDGSEVFGVKKARQWWGEFGKNRHFSGSVLGVKSDPVESGTNAQDLNSQDEDLKKG